LRSAPWCILKLRTDPHNVARSVRRGLLIVAGTASAGLGVVGIAVPILPTTPFLLLAAACYVRGSERMYNGLLNNRILGEYIRSYREGRGLPARIKVLTICLLWITIGYSTVFVVDAVWIRTILLIIAAGVTIHLLTIGTYRGKGAMVQ
jgi:uncharacterized membrane protein YbaN (DUF454 family)